MKLSALLVLLAAFILPSSWLCALDITAEGGSVIVAPGKTEIGGKTITVTQRTVLAVEPAPIIEIKDEKINLSADKPQGYAKGSRLKAVNVRDTNARGAFVPGSQGVRIAEGGELLKEGDDYVVGTEWGHLGLGDKSRATVKDVVLVNYKYSQMRMDTIQVSASGEVNLKKGVPHLSVPVPPEADAGSTAVAHVWVNHRDTVAKTEQIYPILERALQAPTATTAGLIPKTLAKIKAGQPVTIVCWGDSVTSGGNASPPEFKYVDVFAAGLKTRFPQARIEVKNISAGGSNSRQWLSPDQFKYRGLEGDANPARFENVLKAKPDLVTIEFVNDAGLSPKGVEDSYSEILKRLEPTGAEVILITPHFTAMNMMGFNDMKGVEKRPYVLGLRAFAKSHNIALADASARWEHLWKEGIPYTTLLHNTINHPDNRGHRLFAEELWKCFE